MSELDSVKVNPTFRCPEMGSPEDSKSSDASI